VARRRGFVSLLLLTALACGDPDDSGLSVGSQAGGSNATTDEATTAASTSAGAPTTTGPGDTSTGGVIDDTGSEPGSTAGEADTTAGATVPDTGETTATAESGGCPEGQQGCPCGQNDACGPGLMCAGGVCVELGAVCGDGVVDGGEACDDGPDNADDAACKSDCTLQVCGDGSVGPGETCDDGNQQNGDGCENTCTASRPTGDACGQPGDGVWFQIDYENAFSVSNPDITYSNTPGWGAGEWAPQGMTEPDVVDLFNNISVEEDQIGTVAILGGSAAIRVYFGLAGLSYDYATACVEGRSYSVGSSVTFLVSNPKNDCGNTGMMANDWTVHATGVDVGDCFIGGDDFQAVQIEPMGGSDALSLKRLRVTLHGATY
jgi:cysteine-rich repeat protein